MDEKTRSLTARLSVFVVGLVWGSTWVASRQGVLYMPALQFAGIRQLIGGALFLLYFLPRGIRFPKGREWLPIIALAFFNFVISNGLSTWGVAFIPAGLGAIIGSMYPLWLLVLGVVYYRTWPSILRVAGILLGMLGIGIIFHSHLSYLFEPSFRFGLYLSLFATLSWAVGTLYTKSHAAVFNPYQSIGYQMLLSGIILYIISMVQGVAVDITAIPWQSWISIGYLIFFGSVIGFVCYLYALQHLPAEQVSVYAYMNPLVAMMISHVLFNERLDAIMIFGAVTALSGVFLVNRTTKEQ